MKQNIQQYQFVRDKLTPAMRDYLDSMERQDTFDSRLSQLPNAEGEAVMIELKPFEDAVSFSVIEIPVTVHGELMDLSTAVDILEKINGAGVTPSSGYAFGWSDISPSFFIRDQIDTILKRAEENAAKFSSPSVGTASSSSSMHAPATSSSSGNNFREERLSSQSEEKRLDPVLAPLPEKIGEAPKIRKRNRKKNKKDPDIIVPVLPELPELPKQHSIKLKETEKALEPISFIAEYSGSSSLNILSVSIMDDEFKEKAPSRQFDEKISFSVKTPMKTADSVLLKGKANKSQRKKRNKKESELNLPAAKSSFSASSSHMAQTNPRVFSPDVSSSSHFFKKPECPNRAPSALHLAAARGDIKKIKDLVKSEAVAHIDQPDAHSGRTALHEAAFHGKSEAVKLLVSLGADPRCSDHSLKTARDLARQKKNMELYKLLTQIQCGYSAVKSARGAFCNPLPPLDMNLGPPIKDARAQYYDIFLELVEKKYKAKAAEWERISTKLTHQQHTLVFILIEMNAYLETAVDKDYHEGKFGELSRACLAFLLQQDIQGLYFAKFNYMTKYGTFTAGANCIAMSPAQPSNKHYLPAWPVDTLIYDPYRAENERLYFINYPPEMNAINDIKHGKAVFLDNNDTSRLQFFSHRDTIAEIRYVDPLLHERVIGLIQTNYDLLCTLQPKGQEAEIVARNTM